MGLSDFRQFSCNSGSNYTAYEHARHLGHGSISVFDETRWYVQFAHNDHVSDDCLVPAYDDIPSIIAPPTRQQSWPVTANYTQLSSTDEPTTAMLHIFFTRYNLQLTLALYGRASSYFSMPRYMPRYAHHHYPHTHVHPRPLNSCTYVSFAIHNVQFYLPRICIYIVYCLAC